VEAIIYLALTALSWFVLVRVVKVYCRQGGKLPIDFQRLLNLLKWWHTTEWPQTEASITGTRICAPGERFRNLSGGSFPPNRIGICFEFDANGSRYEGKFSVGFVGMDWATMATGNAVGQKVRSGSIRRTPKDGIPVQNE
jgi:hypothetical protein